VAVAPAVHYPALLSGCTYLLHLLHLLRLLRLLHLLHLLRLLRLNRLTHLILLNALRGTGGAAEVVLAGQAAEANSAVGRFASTSIRAVAADPAAAVASGGQPCFVHGERHEVAFVTERSARARAADRVAAHAQVCVTGSALLPIL
jgi:hypothetical protein